MPDAPPGDPTSTVVEDALTGDVVILAPARAARPDDFRRRHTPAAPLLKLGEIIRCAAVGQRFF